MKPYHVTPDPRNENILHVGVTVEEDGAPVNHDFAVRKSHWESLKTPKAQAAYLQECHDYHHPAGPDGQRKRKDRRAAWDAEDKAAEEAKWTAKPVGRNGDNVLVEVAHGGLTVQVTVPADAADKAQAIKDAWAVAKAAKDAEAAELAAFALT